jgi:AcrR family transcriptional regulator
LLDATRDLIARDGWSALRINRVADEAGIAKSVVYAIFGSMEELQRSVMQREQERSFDLAGRSLEAARKESDPIKAVTDGMKTFLEGVAGQPATWQLVLVPADNTPPSVRTAILEGRERWRREIESTLRPLFGPDEPDIELISHVVRGNVEYLARLIIEDPDRFTAERMANLGSRVAGNLLGLLP